MALTCPTNSDSNVINIDLGATISIQTCVNAYLNANIAALVAAGISIPGIPDFSLSLDMLLAAFLEPNVPTCLQNSLANPHPLPIFTTRNITPILVTTILPTTVVPLNPLSAVKPTIPPTLPFTSVTPTPPPTIPPTPIVKPTVTLIPPGSPCDVNPCNFLNF